MTTNLLTISKVSVGGSDEFPVLRVREQASKSGPADQTRASTEEIVWSLTCLGKASGPTTVRAFNAALQAALAKRSVAVVLTESGQATTLDPDDCLPGYPEVRVTAVPEQSVGEWQYFDLEVRAIRVLPDGEDLVSLTYETTTTINADGTTEISQRGEVRVANGEDAEAWVGAEILGPAETAAGTAGRTFVQRITTNADAAWCRYEFTSSDAQTGGTSGVSEASVEDRTTQDQTGRIVRSISGYAVGSAAAAFAADQELTQDTNLLLVRKEGPTPPSVPGNQVRFRYEYLQGVTVSGFPGIFVVSLNETIDTSGGGFPIQATEFWGSTPGLRRLAQRPTVYRQSSSIEFLGGGFEDHGLTGLFDDDKLSGLPQISKSSESRLRRVTVTREYIYDIPLAENAVPNPRYLEVLT